MTCLALGLAAFALANAAPSFAYVTGAGLADGGTTLSYLAGAGHANNVTVELVGGGYVLTDSGVTTFPDADGAEGCIVSGNQATCPATTALVSVATIRVNVSDGDDRVAIGAPTSALVFGRDGADTLIGGPAEDTLSGFLGDDTINARGGGRDTVQCEAGADFAIADADDVLSECEQLDLPPETTIVSGPEPRTADNTPDFTFSSNEEPNVIFECSLDGGAFGGCSSPFTSPTLADGSHSFEVQASDEFGPDPTAATVNFTVTSNPVGASGLPPGLIVVRPPASFVLIAGHTIRVSRKRIATVTLNCSGNRDCAGELTLTTAKRIKLSRKRRRFVKLGAATFFIPAPRTLTVKIPLTKRAFRIVRKRKRIKTMVTVTDRDRVGRARISIREVFLKTR